jgi:AcrR family transcriptional regulator
MNPEEDVRTRRTEGVRTRGRSARVVNEVLVATAEEIGRVGYAALRIEDVAERAGVNKTTIYRRWPTKASLVGAALKHQVEAEEQPDTGSLREDLLMVLRRARNLWSSPIGKGLVRMMQAERAHPEVEAISRVRQKEHRAQRIALVERAVERGELPPGTNLDLIVDLTFSPVVARMIKRDEVVGDEYLETVVDFVVAGGRAGHAIPGKARL